MKLIFFIYFILVSSLTYAKSGLQGSWGKCEVEDGYHYEHIVEFEKNGVEIEFHVFRQESEKPCKGKILSIVGRRWSYKYSSGEYRSSLEKTFATVHQIHVIKEFNKIGACKFKNWKIDEPVDCTKNHLIDFEERVGYKTKHTYVLKGDEMIVLDSESETSVYKEVKE